MYQHRLFIWKLCFDKIPMQFFPENLYNLFGTAAVNTYQSSYFLIRPQKSTKSSPSIWQYVVRVKSTVKISSIFVAFLENTNFK